MRTVSISKSRALPNLPPYGAEHHRKVLATVMKRRAAIDKWRKNVNLPTSGNASSSESPLLNPKPTYQSRLMQEFVELKSALPTRLRPATVDRVAIMVNAIKYISYIQSAIRRLAGRAPLPSIPECVIPSTENMTPIQARTHKENCMLRMLAQLLPKISVMPSKIQLVEHATQTIHQLETEFFHLAQAQRLKTTASSATSASLSCPPTPQDVSLDLEAEAHSVSASSFHSVRLPSVQEILNDQRVDTDLRLPPLRLTTL